MSKFPDKAHQYKIREKKAEEYEGKGYWDKIDLDLGKARVRRVSKKTAEKIIYEYEWLGTMANTDIHYGIFFDDIYCGGVACIGGIGALGATSANMQFGIEKDELAVLARGACPFWTPKGTASKLIAYSLKLLRRQTDKKLVLAFADMEAGEIGTVYQATNWWYWGDTGELTAVRKGNVELHQRTFDAKVRRITDSFEGDVSLLRVRNILKERGWKRIKKPKKHKYIYVLDDELKDKLYNENIKDYPKRD